MPTSELYRTFYARPLMYDILLKLKFVTETEFKRMSEEERAERNFVPFTPHKFLFRADPCFALISLARLSRP